MSISTPSTKLLAIETSCDETAVAILECYKGTTRIISNIVSSQVKLHSKWGGVVPNLAAREHLKNISVVMEKALRESGYSLDTMDALAVTQGPGLIPALLVGVEFAKTICYKHHKPLLGIHHIEGHIYANFIDGIAKKKTIKSSLISHPTDIQFPILCLVVSGGHTQLVHMKNHFDYTIIGQTLDDAAGEAFDKVARILDIGYPGGPIIAQWANKFKASGHSVGIRGSRFQIKFPRPMLNRKNYDFSFSGLKTAVLYETKKNPTILRDPNYIAEVCYEFQQAVVDVLIQKTLGAANEYQPKTIMLAGGVSANKELRQQLGKAITECMPTVIYKIPDIYLTGDNAAMIGVAAALRFEKMGSKDRTCLMKNWKDMQPDANLGLR